MLPQVEGSAVLDRKERFVLMERAMGVAQEAQAGGMKLTLVAWNSLLLCAARCGQLNRALELLEGMQVRVGGSVVCVCVGGVGLLQGMQVPVSLQCICCVHPPSWCS